LLLNLIVPRINDHMTEAIVEAVYAEEGEALAIGAKLFDITVDLSAAAPHDCPPISHYRLVLRERAWLRRIDARRREVCPLGAPLALFSTLPDEPVDQPPARRPRMTVAMIMHQHAWSQA